MSIERTPVPRLLLRPEELAQALGIGRSKAYQLIASCQIPSLRIGRARRVTVRAAEAWVESRQPVAGLRGKAEREPEAVAVRSTR